jgi:hypothetical protein
VPRVAAKKVALAAVALAGTACLRSAPAVDCTAYLVAPTYPSIAASARLSVRGIQAAMSIDGGEVRALQLTFPQESDRYSKLFRPAVEDALRRSRFNPECNERTETFTYDFVPAESTDPDPPSTQRVAFRPPNHIVVSITGAVIDVSAVDRDGRRTAPSESKQQ